MRAQTDTDEATGATRAAALHKALATLEASGADRFDPVRFRYIKTMAQRSARQHRAVTNLLIEKSWGALQDYQSRFTNERNYVETLINDVTAQHPDMAEQLQCLLQAGEFRAIRRLVQHLETPAQGDTLACVTRQLQAGTHDTYSAPTSSPQDLKAVRYFREAAQQQQAEKLVSDALMDAPESAGPLNPQKLALHSLAIMRDISPAYLGHFVAYVDTLFWLERPDGQRSSK